MARMPAVGPNPTIPTSTSPNTSVWMARDASSTLEAARASGRGACRLRADSSPRGNASTAASSEPSVAIWKVVQVARARAARKSASTCWRFSTRSTVPSSLRNSSRSGPNHTSRKLGYANSDAVLSRFCQGARPQPRSPAASSVTRQASTSAPYTSTSARNPRRPCGHQRLGKHAWPCLAWVCMRRAVRGVTVWASACQWPGRRREWACRRYCRCSQSRCSSQAAGWAAVSAAAQLPAARLAHASQTPCL